MESTKGKQRETADLKPESTDDPPDPLLPDGSTPRSDVENVQLRERIKPNADRLAKTLDVGSFLHLLKEGLQLKCKEIEDKEEQARALLSHLSNEKDCEDFCKVIAGMYPDMFELILERVPTDAESDYCIHPLMDEIRQRVAQTRGPHDDQFVGLRLKEYHPGDGDRRFYRGRYEEQCLREDPDLPPDDPDLPPDDPDLPPDDPDQQDLEGQPVDLVQPGQRLVILGRAGAGKTMLARQALDQWLDPCTEGSGPQKAVFLLDMKLLADKSDPVSLAQLLGNSFTSGSDKEFPQLPLWLKANAVRIVIWLDNIDGLTIDPALRGKRLTRGCELMCCPLDWCFSIMDGHVLPDMCKIITARSFAPPLELQDDYIIEMVGLSEKGIDEFITKNVPDKLQARVTDILVNDPILMSMCEVPFWCSSLCKYITTNGDKFTYSRIVAFLHLEYIKRLRQMVKNVQLYIQLVCRTLLLKSDGRDRKLVFGEEDFRKADISELLQKQMEQSGLLVCKETRDKQGGIHRKMEFYHFVVQEMFAAAALNQSDMDAEEALSKLSPVGRLFYTGVALDKDNDIMRDFNHNIGLEEKTAVVQRRRNQIETFMELRTLEKKNDFNVSKEVIRITYEGQSSSLVKKTSQILALARLQELGRNQWLTAIDKYGLIFVSSKSKQKPEKMDKKDFRCNVGDLSNNLLRRLEEAFNNHISLHTFHIDDPLNEDQMDALVMFMEESKKLQVIRSTAKGQLEVLKRGQLLRTLYYWRAVGGKPKILLPSQYLREDLKEWLSKESIVSGIDTKDRKLVVFLPREREQELRTWLEERVNALGPDFRQVYKVQVCHQPVGVVEEDGPAKYGSGAQVCYHGADHRVRYATCGAFVRDETGKLYMLSSCHGEKPKFCYLLEPGPTPKEQWKRHPCKRVAHVFKSDPLLDAILVEVDSEEVKEQIDPLLHYPYEKSALCCVFTDKMEDLTTDSDAWPVVVKGGRTGQPVTGRLSLYDCEIPQKQITGALVITGRDSESFSHEGDSGSVIFQHDTHEHRKEQTTGFRLHEGLAMLSHGLTGLYPDKKCSLAFRLNHVIQYFNEEMQTELHLLPLNYLKSTGETESTMDSS